MPAETVVAIRALIVAVVSLAVTVHQARATRTHYRPSVRPVLQLRVGVHPDTTAGLRLVNAGLLHPHQIDALNSAWACAW